MDAHDEDAPPPPPPGPDDRAILRACTRLMEVGQRHVAREHLEHWLARHPDDAEGHALLAWCHALGRDDEEAMEEAREAVRLAPDWAYTHAVLGDVHLVFHRFRKAERALRTAVELAPAAAGYHATLSEALLYQPFRARAALRAAEAGLALDPENVVCARVRARALLALFRTRKAREAMDYALRLEPESAETHFMAGDLAFATGDNAALRAHMRETLRLDPGNKQAELMLGLFLEFSRKCAAFTVQLQKWVGGLRWVAAVWIAELVGVLTFMEADVAFLVFWEAVWLVIIGGPAVWVKLRHPYLIGEMDEWVSLRPQVRKDIRLILRIYIGIFLALPLIAVLFERVG